MTRLLTLLVLAVDPLVAPSTLSLMRDGKLVRPEPDYWEGPVFCGNGATPRAEMREGDLVGVGKAGRVIGRMWLVCDARTDGGRP